MTVVEGEFKWQHPLVADVRARSHSQRKAHRADAIRTLMAEQGGVCAICRSPRHLQLDHDHDSGLVRGILCRDCNGAHGAIVTKPTRWKRYTESPPARARWAWVSTAGYVEQRRASRLQLKQEMVRFSLQPLPPPPDDEPPAPPAAGATLA